MHTTHFWVAIHELRSAFISAFWVHNAPELWKCSSLPGRNTRSWRWKTSAKRNLCVTTVLPPTNPPLKQYLATIVCVVCCGVHRGLLAAGCHRLPHPQRRPPPPGGSSRAGLCTWIHWHLSLPGNNHTQTQPKPKCIFLGGGEWVFGDNSCDCWLHMVCFRTTMASGCFH